ncbi:MAG: alpha/beta fold hydrolase, partial [Chitinophagales bacterium]|nr:alpha/beta fold hydrolase [Chitinophagales bacterium]
MAVIRSNYKPPFWYRNAHWQTIFPAVFRRLDPGIYTREKIFTADGDFLNLDWVRSGAQSCVILSHGLEGASNRGYMLGMANYLSNNGYDVCAWNFRGCGDEMNENLRMYHSGFTSDLQIVIDHIAKSYDQIYLIGFSAGGNISLKYLGENPAVVNSAIKACIAFSAPTDLGACSKELEKPSNFIYQKRFLKLLGEKIVIKEQQFPEHVSSHKYNQLKTLREFDDRYTAPFFGFKDA